MVDADIVLLSRVDDVFEASERGEIVAGCDACDLTFDEEYAAYSRKIVGKSIAGINSGLLCLDVNLHWDLIGLWAYSSNYGAYSPHKGYPLSLPGWGDQGLLNALLVLLDKQEQCRILPHGVWHDFRYVTTLKILEENADASLVVLNCEQNSVQRINHCVGYKWWQSEAGLHHANGDKLKCFRHFSELNLANRRC